MICKPCTKKHHKKCEDKGCCCQHRKPTRPEPATGAPGE